MNQFLNTLFPNGYLIVGGIIAAAIMFGYGCAEWVGLDEKGSGDRKIAVVLGSVLVVVAGYSSIISVTQADQPLAEPATTQAMPATTSNQELVYVYGNEKPMTRVEHERQLAYSAAHSPGDDE